jgi:hypothetical protein
MPGQQASRHWENHEPASLYESHESNPKAIFRARSSSLILAEENCPISRTSRCRGTVKMLSVFITDGRGSPSALPTETSVGVSAGSAGNKGHHNSSDRVADGISRQHDDWSRPNRRR